MGVDAWLLLRDGNETALELDASFSVLLNDGVQHQAGTSRVGKLSLKHLHLLLSRPLANRT